MPKGHWKYMGKNTTKSCVFYKQYICSVVTELGLGRVDISEELTMCSAVCTKLH